MTDTLAFPLLEQALERAVAEAEKFRGATSPNPPVGACALDEQGNVLAVAAHQRAGEFHAERLLLEKLRILGLFEQLHTLVVTLEPCNHYGRTPPCTEAILSSPAKSVVFAVRDPNPKAAGGEEALRAAGLHLICLEQEAALPAVESARRQLAPFVKGVRYGKPWVTVKQAFDEQGSMIPPVGAKTFTSPESLRLAHLLRRRSDAILTGSGTILADQPEFTVRHVDDHPGKLRVLLIADRRGSVEQSLPHYVAAAQSRGFSVRLTTRWREDLRALASSGVLEVLVEAGPRLTAEVLESAEWDEHWTIQKRAGQPDEIEVRFREP